MESQVLIRKTERKLITGKITRKDLLDLITEKGDEDVIKAFDENLQSCNIFVECSCGKDLEIGGSDQNLDIKFKVVSVKEI